jgi:hypothetical protein
MRSAMAAVQSYRYTGEVSEIRGNTTMTSASLSGEWAATDQQYMKIETDQGFTERITLDGRMFIRESSNGGVWRERQVTVVGTGNIIESIPDFTSIQRGPDQQVSDIPTFIITGIPSIDCTHPGKGPSSGFYPDQPSTYKLFVRKDNFRLVRTEVQARGCSDESEITDYLSYNLFDYNRPVTIEVSKEVSPR